MTLEHFVNNVRALSASGTYSLHHLYVENEIFPLFYTK